MRAPTEQQEQERVVAHLRGRGLAFTATANGAYLGGTTSTRAITMGKLKKAGLATGIPDLLIFNGLTVDDTDYAGMAIEVKRTKGSRLQDNQAAWLQILESCGWFCVVAKGAQEAIDAIERVEWQKPIVLYTKEGARAIAR